MMQKFFIRDYLDMNQKPLKIEVGLLFYVSFVKVSKCEKKNSLKTHILVNYVVNTAFELNACLVTIAQHNHFPSI